MEIISCEQRSEQWFETRMGRPTASCFQTILAHRTKTEAKGRKTYMRKLAGEILTGEPMDSFSNHHMRRGIALEPEALRFYEFQEGAEVERVGHIINDLAGASPDGLVGDQGLVEIKTKLPHLMIGALEDDDVLKEHVAQVQGQLWVAERAWCDLVIYWRGLPLFIKRYERDEAYIETLHDEVFLFVNELDALVERIRAY